MTKINKKEAGNGPLKNREWPTANLPLKQSDNNLPP